MWYLEACPTACRKQTSRMFRERLRTALACSDDALGACSAARSTCRRKKKTRRLSSICLLAYLYAWIFGIWKRNLGPVRWWTQNSKTTDAPKEHNIRTCANHMATNAPSMIWATYHIIRMTAVSYGMTYGTCHSPYVLVANMRQPHQQTSTHLPHFSFPPSLSALSYSSYIFVVR